MLQLRFMGVNWGVDQIEEEVESGELVRGIQINLLDPQSSILVQVPFSGESLLKLAQGIAEGLNDEQRRQLASSLAGGIVLPG